MLWRIGNCFVLMHDIYAAVELVLTVKYATNLFLFFTFHVDVDRERVSVSEI